MAFRLEDFKKTMRKSSDGSGIAVSVFPHQIKDKKVIARLEIAIRTFDNLVGKRRGEMNAQTMTDFFGDPRLARGVVACLGQFYKYRTPKIAEIVGTNPARLLAVGGMTTPAALRAHTYQFVNAEHDGFLTEAGRAECYTGLALPFGLSAHHWDALLHLDAEENQILTRLGAVPCPVDIVALYNFHSLDTCLRRADQIVLDLRLSASAADDVRALARGLGVKAVVSATGGVTLASAPDEKSPITKTSHVGRCLLSLAQAFATRDTSGHIEAEINGRRCRLRLSADIWRALGVSSAAATPATLSFRRRAAASDTLYKDLLKLRAAGLAAGWRVGRMPAPLVSAQGVFIPDLMLSRNDRSVYLTFGDTPSGDWGVPILSVSATTRAMDAAIVLARADDALHSLFALPAAPTVFVPSALRTLCDQAAERGIVRTSDAQRALHLLDESPLIAWVRQAEDPRVRYIPGVGLCSQEMVTAIARDQQTLLSE